MPVAALLLCALGMPLTVLAQAAAPPETPATTPAAATATAPPPVVLDVDKLQQAEREAELELMVREIRLGLIRAWTRVAQGDCAAALRIASRTRQAVEALPESVDRRGLLESIDRVELEARSRRPGRAETKPEPAKAAAQTPSAYTSLTELDRRFDAHYEQALQRHDVPPGIRQQIVTYPPHWQALTEYRAQRHTGTLFEGEPFVSPDGETLQTVLYDVQTLVMSDTPTASPPGFVSIWHWPSNPQPVVGPYATASGFYAYPSRPVLGGVPILQFGAPPLAARQPTATPQEKLDELVDLIEVLLAE